MSGRPSSYSSLVGSPGKGTTKCSPHPMIPPVTRARDSCTKAYPDFRTFRGFRQPRKQFKLISYSRGLELDAIHVAGQDIVEQDSMIEQKILAAHTCDPISVRKRDSNGFSALHLAAGLYDLRTVNALLALPRDAGLCDDLQARDNADGLTPLKVCEHEM
ncbi:hypothetical protein CERSUDRAFT_88813 [Gelatoporia subvermispora B]|uniref:Uncharacterized protein n=1 Tax=Ceriporiopsis subvermispora (strain B) TaxID=914234 RepID=M2QYS0_CERS8|nr:hypothetical protein CERSUDRAFT_88813 [Gelatoporia subvermispora B]